MYMTALASRRVGGVGFSSCIFECEMYPPKLRFPPLNFLSILERLLFTVDA